MKIAISGKIASGKTTLAQAIQQTDERVEIYSFASPIKEIAYEYFGMSKDPALKNRPLLQDIGRNLRLIDSNVWVKAFLNKTNSKTHVVCDDLRFKNEAKMLKKAGFLLIRLNIDRDEQVQRLKNTYPQTWEEHCAKLSNVSETELDNCEHMFDLVIATNTVKDINSVVHRILSVHKDEASK